MSNAETDRYITRDITLKDLVERSQGVSPGHGQIVVVSITTPDPAPQRRRPPANLLRDFAVGVASGLLLIWIVDLWPHLGPEPSSAPRSLEVAD